MTAARAMHGVGGRRGQPLWALAGLALCWVGLRATLFEAPAAMPPVVGEVLGPTRKIVHLTEDAIGPPLVARKWPMPPLLPTSTRALAMRIDLPSPAASPASGSRRLPEGRARLAAGHSILWMVGMQALPLLPEVEAALSGERSASAPPFRTARQARWSGDAWIAWRAGADGLGTGGTLTPVYGASQAGAVLRYHLRPDSPHRPAAYARLVHALNGAREGDLAAGLALRPVADVPVVAHGEARLSRRGATMTLRPAAFVSTGVDAAPLGAGLTARGYAQAGYVGGRDGTGFADGSVIAERVIASGGEPVASTGVGLWGGAQRGAARLDLGPSASLRLRLGTTSARLSADYRLRVAGNAQPASGAALTLSAGF